MRNLFDYFIDLTDKRTCLIKDVLLSKGEQVFDFNEKNLKLIKRGDVCLFPPSKTFTKKELEVFPNEIIIFAGKLDNDVKTLVNTKNIDYVDFTKDESFTYKNAILTAEGTLSLIFSTSTKSIFEKEILVFGFGRIGKALSLLLSKLGVNFSISTFNEKEFNDSLIYTNNRFFNKEYSTFISKYDVIINTIPFEFFTLEEISKIKKESLFIELASVSSINKDYQKEFIYEQARGLPQKTTLVSATNLMIEQMEKKLWKKP